MIGLVDRDVLSKYAKQDKANQIKEWENSLEDVSLTERKRNSILKKIQSEKAKKLTPTCKWIKNRWQPLYEYALANNYIAIAGIGAGCGKTTFARKLGAKPVYSLEEAKELGIKKFVIVTASDRVKSLAEYYNNAEQVYVVACDRNRVEQQRLQRISNPNDYDIHREDLEITLNSPINDVVLYKFSSFVPSAKLVENHGNKFVIKGVISDIIPSLEQIKLNRTKEPVRVATIGNFSLGPTMGHDRLLKKLITVADTLGTKPIVFVSKAVRQVDFHNGKTLRVTYEDKIQSFRDTYGEIFEYLPADWNDASNLFVNVKFMVLGSDRYNDEAFRARIDCMYDDISYVEVPRCSNQDEIEGYSSSAAREALAKEDWETFFKIQGRTSSWRYLEKYL